MLTTDTPMRQSLRRNTKSTAFDEWHTCGPAATTAELATANGLDLSNVKTEERGQTSLTWKLLQRGQDLTHMATLTTQTETYTTHAILLAKVKLKCERIWRETCTEKWPRANAGETLEFTTGLPLGACTMDSGFTAVRCV